MNPMFPTKFLAALLSLGFVMVGVGVTRAEDPSAADDKSKPKTLQISGVFEATEAQEITTDPEHISSLELKRIVPHGTNVSKGQNLVWFETEEIDKQIKEAEIDLRLSKLTLEDEEFKYEQFLETQTLDKTAAERARKHAQQDYDNFVQVDRDHQKLTAEFNMKSSLNSLANAMEELQQLEQMYKEDDLTEESEEIVLKRAKQAVEFAQFRLDGTKIQSDRSVSQTIPRTQAQQEESLAKAILAYQKSIRDLTSDRRRRDIEIDRQREKFKEEQEKLVEMREERKQIVLSSPIDGIALHGKLTRGKLGEKPSVLEAGSKVTPKQVLVTIVSPEKLQIRVDLEEKDLGVVTVGTECKLTAKAFPDFEAVATVKSISSVPYAGTKFDCVVTFRQTKQQPIFMPTMTCELEFALAEEETAEDETAEDGTDNKGKDETVEKAKKKGKAKDANQ